MKRIYAAICVLVAATLCIMSASALHADEPMVSSLSTSFADMQSDGWTLRMDGQNYYVPNNIIVGYDNTESGEYVEIAQMALKYIDWHYTNANCNAGDVDGKYGPVTFNAVCQFQVYCNRYLVAFDVIAVDGDVGPLTWERMAGLCTY